MTNVLELCFQDDKFQDKALPIAEDERTFRAAVYEHTVIEPKDCRFKICNRTEALNYMQSNLEIYEQQTELAASKGADIIVFPEDGLYGWVFTRSTVEPFLESIPDPVVITWNPCEYPDRFGGNHQVLTRLSCLARKFEIFVAANMGDRQSCNSDTENINNCPANGEFYFNTNVLFDKQGNLIARYHKQHLFEGERLYWNFPPKVENVYVDTSIGRLGFATCFDILFADPAVDLVEQYHIDTLLFPTAWTNVLPLFTAVGFHSAWAHGMGVNVLAANARNASVRRTGSGIYSSSGPVSFFHSDDPNNAGVLLVADLPVRTRKTSKKLTIELSREPETNPSPHFGSSLFHDEFEFAVLNKTSDLEKTIVCHNQLCCKAEYKFSNTNEESDTEPELFAIGAFDGMHFVEGQYYLQVCVVLKCASTNYQSCGSPVSDSRTRFDYLKLSGNHSTVHVFPEVVLSGPKLAPNQFHVHHSKLVMDSSTSDGLLTAALFGRWYERDSESNY